MSNKVTVVLVILSILLQATIFFLVITYLMSRNNLETYIVYEVDHPDSLLNRTEIIDRYEGVFEEFGSNITQQQQQENTANEVFEKQLRQFVLAQKNVTDQLITEIEDEIEEDKTNNSSKTDVIKCLDAEEEEVEKIKKSQLILECVNTTTFDLLGEMVDDTYPDLSDLAGNAISSCGDTFKNDSENPLFVDCLNGKIFDLYNQTSFVAHNLVNLRYNIEDSLENCIQEDSTDLINQILYIYFVDVNNCLRLMESSAINY